MRVFFIILFFLAVPIKGYAASFQISPVTFDLTADTTATELQITNLGEVVGNIQVRVFEWSQNEGVDVLTPTTSLVASPPAIVVEGGQSHLVRLVRTEAQPVVGEESYRLIIDEIPSTQSPSNMAVNFAVRYSIPIFFSQPGVNSELSWNLEKTTEELALQVENTGTRHVRLENVQLTSPDGAIIEYPRSMAGYILPQSKSTLRFPLDENFNLAPGSRVTITAEEKFGPIFEEVTLGVGPNNGR